MCFFQIQMYLLENTYLNMKQAIRIDESQLREMITESVKNTLNELTRHGYPHPNITIQPEIIIKVLLDICSKYCGKTPNMVANGNPSETIANLCDFYARYYVCPNRQIVKPAFVDAVCYIFSVAIPRTFGFSVQRNKQINGVLQSPEFEGTRNVIYQDFMDLMNKIQSVIIRNRKNG